MNPKTDKLVKRTTMVATATAAHFLLTADYGPELMLSTQLSGNEITSSLECHLIRTNGIALQFCFGAGMAFSKNAILPAERSVKDFMFGPKKVNQENETKKLSPSAGEEHP